MPTEPSFASGTGNRLLDSLPSDDFEAISGALEEVQLELREPLCESGARIESVYFPVHSVVSLLARVEGSPGVEVATIGNEGLVGVSLSWGAAILNPAEFLQVQVPGAALRMGADDFLAALGNDAGLASVVRRYTQALFSQLSQQVACNGLHSVEERCARWMLLTHDRVDTDEFPLTQEFLAQMLGVRRASVSLVASILQQAGFIRYTRGRVEVLDRAGLENASCQCYQILREVFDRLLP